MIAFQGLANMKEATIAMVAPRHLRGADRDRDGPVRGDSGGVGLQPLRDQGRAHDLRYDAFSEEFSSILQRQAHVDDVDRDRAESRPRRCRHLGALLTASGRRIRRKLKAEINVVPYIDVMLVLLIIFMVTAPLLNLGTDIQLPHSQRQVAAARPRTRWS